MLTLRYWKKGVWVVYLPAILFLMLSAASAADNAGKSSEKNKKNGPPAVAAPSTGLQLSEEQTVLLQQGPPNFDPPDYYIKVRGNTAGTIKYFKNGHPDNNSEWEWYGQ